MGWCGSGVTLDASRTGWGEKKMKPYACSYFHDGTQYGVTIYANDWDDAAEKCKQQGLKLDGELVCVIPGRFGFFARMICAIRNFLRL